MHASRYVEGSTSLSNGGGRDVALLHINASRRLAGQRSRRRSGKTTPVEANFAIWFFFSLSPRRSPLERARNKTRWLSWKFLQLRRLRIMWLSVYVCAHENDRTVHAKPLMRSLSASCYFQSHKSQIEYKSLTTWTVRTQMLTAHNLLFINSVECHFPPMKVISHRKR